LDWAWKDFEYGGSLDWHEKARVKWHSDGRGIQHSSIEWLRFSKNS
jgi:hypothetical protein